MDENIKPIFRELEDRFVKISWTHKVQEIQAGLYQKQSSFAELVKVGDKLNGIKLPEDFVEKMAQMAIGNRKTDEALVGMCRNNGQINAEMEKLLHPEGKDEK